MTSSGANGPEITSGSNKSIWLDTANPIITNKLSKNSETEVLVIGGGIAGLTTAYCLAKKGKKVMLVEDGFIGSGESGRTTAHITCALDDRYYELENIFGQRKTMLAANSHLMAIQWLDNTIKSENIQCNYKNVPGYLFLHETDRRETLEKEFAATRRAGIITELINEIPGISSLPDNMAIKFPGQRQFHILEYLAGLTEAVKRYGGKIYTESKADKIDKNGARVNGYDVKAEYIVVATNTPVNDLVTMHTKQWPYRTYVVGLKIPKGAVTPALWWDTGNQHSEWNTAPYHYVRLEETSQPFDILISGGEDHKTGQAEEEKISANERYEKLIEWTRRRFPMAEDTVYRWSGQVMEPVDSLAFIGKNPGDENIFIITGDSGNGMTHGTIGGILITDLIEGRHNIWSDLYSPSRIPVKKTGTYIKEAANMIAGYADWFSKADFHDLDRIKAGNGGIYSSGLKKYAVYRDTNNNLFAYSALCPHLGGIVQWNDDEKSFDCPVHGSRFAPTGEMINGPSLTGLKPLQIKD